VILAFAFSLSQTLSSDLKNHAPLPYTERGAAGVILRFVKCVRVARLLAPGAKFVNIFVAYRLALSIAYRLALIAAYHLVLFVAYCLFLFVAYRLVLSRTASSSCRVSSHTFHILPRIVSFPSSCIVLSFSSCVISSRSSLKYRVSI